MPTYTAHESVRFLFIQMTILAATVHRTVATPGQYLAYPGRSVTPTQQPRSKDRGFFAPVTVHRTVTVGATIRWPTRGAR